MATMNTETIHRYTVDLPHKSEAVDHVTEIDSVTEQNEIVECDVCGNLESLELKIGISMEALKEYARRDVAKCDTCSILLNCLERCGAMDDLDQSDDYYISLSTMYQRRAGRNGDNKSLLVDIHNGPGTSPVCKSVEIFVLPGESSPWPAVGTARSLSGQTSPESSVTLAKAWLNNCLKYHRRCNPPPRPHKFPRRLIDVRNVEKDGPVKLIETTGQEGRYLCLSHCWGEPENHPPRTTEGGHPVEPGMGFEGELDSDNVMRTLRTIDKHKEGIPWTDLSKTFQDAVSFVRALGESYMWIDSLCIIQDSPQDWAQESTKMADIYQNSYLTIAATKSSNSAGGLFTTPDSRFKEHSFSVTDRGGRERSLHCRQSQNHWFGSSFLRKEETPVPPLLQRAWVYQERVLSPRTLHFGHQEVLWECMSQTSCECSLWPQPEQACPRFDCRSQSRIRGWTAQDLVKEWHRAVSEYSTLALTKSSDRLPAIAGIARQMQKLRRGEDYFAGLWRESCLEDLLWFHNCQQGPGGYRECVRDTLCAPSWSWACVDKAVIEYPFFSEWPQRKAPLSSPQKSRRMAEVVEVSHEGEDAFVGCKNGFIRLRGHLFSVELTLRPVRPLTVDFGACDEFVGYISFYPDCDVSELDCGDASGGQRLYCFLTHAESEEDHRYLLLHAKQQPDVFERVGYFEHVGPGRNIFEVTEEREQKVITIV